MKSDPLLSLYEKAQLLAQKKLCSSYAAKYDCVCSYHLMLVQHRHSFVTGYTCLKSRQDVFVLILLINKNS